MVSRFRTPGSGAWWVVLVELALAAEAADVAPDLEKVEGIEHFAAPQAARELLKRNGFVVVPRFCRQIFSPYMEKRLPPFVTTDSLHRTFHVIFEEQVKKVEAALSADVAAITTAMLARVAAAAGPSDFQRLAHRYFQVAECLLAGGEAPAGAAKEVGAELTLIRAADGVAPSPLFGYRMDYSQFRPRSFYTETPLLRRYFQAMSWYGTAGFRLVSDGETRAAFLIAEAFAADKGVQERWSKIDRLYTYLVGPADDLTPAEYATVLAETEAAQRKGEAKGDRFGWLKQKLARLRDPTICSMPLPPGLMPRWRELTKGLRLFGKRHVPDSEMFTNLCDPAVAGRFWPSGLDVMAVLGSARARGLLDAAGETARQGYEQGFSKSKALFDDLMAAKEPSHYAESLKLAQTLLGPPGDQALPFMRTPAYADKNLMTALALWTSLRHTWQLQAKQSMTCIGSGEGAPPGWVEPNFAFYEQLHRLIERTVAVLAPIEGMDVERLKALDELVQTISAIGRKQVAGARLSPDEAHALAEFGPWIARLSYFTGNAFTTDKWMSLVADVHTEAASGLCLEEAIGAAMPIYVVVPSDGKRYLMLGAVYTQYEFREPIANRLTDEEWRRRVGSGQVPPMPAWASSFVAGSDAAALIERIKKGEMVEDVLWVSDPSIEAFLAKAIAPGGELDGKPNLMWAVATYGRKARARALPALLDYYLNPTGPMEGFFVRRDGTVEKTKFREGGPRAAGASGVLADLGGPEHIPLFEKVVLGTDRDRAYSAHWIIAGIRDKAAERSLLGLLRRVPPDFQERIVRTLGERGTRDVTPVLLEIYPSGSDRLKEAVLEALSRIWGQPIPGEDHSGEPWWPEEMDEATAKALRPKLDALVLRALDSPHSPCFPEAAMAAARLRLTEAVPLLERACFQREPYSAVEALSKLGGEEATRALARLTYLEEAKLSGAQKPPDEENALRGVIEALARLASPLAAPRLFELLQSEGAPQTREESIPERAARVLQALYPKGPKWPGKPDAAQRAKTIAAWKEYLTKHGVPTIYALSPNERLDIAERLVRRGEYHARPADPTRAIAVLLRAERLLPQQANEAAQRLRDRARGQLVALTRAEIRELVESFEQPGFLARQEPPARRLPFAKVFEDYPLDPLRVRGDDYLDAWGNPYRYLNPARHSNDPFEIYSVGPNGKDEDGGGDDIASWSKD